MLFYGLEGSFVSRAKPVYYGSEERLVIIALGESIAHRQAHLLNRLGSTQALGLGALQCVVKQRRY